MGWHLIIESMFLKYYDRTLTRVQWLASCQPRSPILGQQCVLKSINRSIIAHICKPLAKTFTDLCKSKSTALQAQYLPQGELSALTNHV